MCLRCNRRDTCKSLCISALKYVEQDQIQDDPNITYWDNSYLENFWWKDEIKTPMQDISDIRLNEIDIVKIIYRLHFIDRVSYRRIAENIKLSHVGIRKKILAIKNNVPNDDSIKAKVLKLHFLEYKRQVDICNELDMNKQNVHEIINDFLSSLC